MSESEMLSRQHSAEMGSEWVEVQPVTDKAGHSMHINTITSDQQKVAFKTKIALLITALGVFSIMTSALSVFHEIMNSSQMNSSEPVLAAVSRHSETAPGSVHHVPECGNTTFDHGFAADEVNTTAKDDFLIGLSAKTNSLISALGEKLDNQQVQLTNMVATMNTRDAEMSLFKSKVLTRQGTHSTDTDDKQLPMGRYQLERAVVEPYGNHFHCKRECLVELPNFLCHTGCSIHKLNVRLAALNHRDMIAPCSQVQGSIKRPAVRECFQKKVDLLFHKMTEKFGFPRNLVPVNRLGVPECESSLICKHISSPDRECEIVRLNAYITFLHPTYTTECEKTGWFVDMDTAVHNCAMMKLNVLMDAVFS